MRMVGLVRGLFAFALASVAILSLSYGDFMPMGQSLPRWMPWRETWLYGSALLLLAASAGLCFARTALPSAWTICAYQLVWTMMCALPVFHDPLSLGGWYGLCEALAPLVSAWILCVLLRRQSEAGHTPLAGERAVRAAQLVFGTTCIFYGGSHFAYAAYTASMVPAWLPFRLELAYLTGACHIAAGLGIALCILPRLAATLEAIMMSLFGLMVWVPSYFAQPKPVWATPPQNQWSELVVNLLLAAAAWIVAASFAGRPWHFRAHCRA